MRKILGIVFASVLMSFTIWQQKWETAKQIAKKNHQNILLVFSGSDWCGPCIRMHNDILENNDFRAMADTFLVLYNADFPRNKNNQLDATTKKQNEVLADQYNIEGIFPYTLLLDPDGNVIHAWQGMPKESAAVFIAELKKWCESNK